MQFAPRTTTTSSAAVPAAGQTRSMSRPGGVLQGCLIALAVVLVILVGVGIFVAMNAEKWTWQTTGAISKLVIDESQLPASEKPELKSIIDRMVAEGIADTITFEEVGRIIENFTQSPVFAIGIAQHFENAYVQSSGLTDEEKADAALAINRVAQGLANDSITFEQIEQAFAPISTVTTTQSGGQPTAVDFELKSPSQVTAEELKQVVASMKTLADDAGVQEEKVELDLSDEFEKSIEETLGRELAGG